MAEDKSPTVFYLFDVDGTLTDTKRHLTQEMHDFILEVKSKVHCGIVSGFDLESVNKQLKVPAPSLFDYVFTENGLTYHRDGAEYFQTNIPKYLGEDSLQEYIDFVLKYLSEIDIPSKRGQFIEIRSGNLNISPVGRKCSAKDRKKFVELDKAHRIREKFISALTTKFPDNGLAYTKGGQISFDVFPRGWNKRFCLDHIDDEGFEDIHFFGDRCEPGGTDYDVYRDPRVTGHKVTGPKDLKIQLRALLNIPEPAPEEDEEEPEEEN